MADSSKNYWHKRFTILENRSNLNSQSHINSLTKQYASAKRETEKELAVFYNRLAANNDLPNIAAAKKLLTANELKDFHMTLEEYISLAKENGITGDWTKTLENASLKYRISRLEAMKIQMDNQVNILMNKEIKGLEAFTKSAYEEAYYHGAYEIAKGTGIGKTLFQLDEKKINTVIHKPWAADGRNFSERVWGQHRPQLITNLHNSLTQSIIRGEGPDKAIKNIASQFDKSLSSAARLVQTEEAYFSSVAQKQTFNDLDVEQYEVIATLDGHTSEICQELDGKVFKMSEYESGVTAPPFHVRCRTTTAPYFDDEVSTRAARNQETGNTEQIPSNIKYEDWKKGYIVKEETKDSNNKFELTEETKNMSSILDRLNVSYNEVKNHKPLSEDEIIKALSGGDKTKGSCASLGLAYVGQKNGLDVLDFRDGESRNFFSQNSNIRKILELPNIRKISEIARSSITSGKKLLESVIEGNEYYFVSGKHASIVRKNNGLYQYLELQSSVKNGWINFNGNVRYTLYKRFGETKGYDCESYMFNVKDAEGSADLHKLLGYINTAIDKQKKGIGGYEK